MTLRFNKLFFSAYWLWALILLVTSLIQSESWGNHVRYDRALVEQGQYWLLLSGHLAHLSWSHWALNMAGLAIVAFFFSSHAGLWQWSFVCLVAALGVGLGIYWFHPQIGWYVGLSGVLHGLFVFAAIREIRHYPNVGYVLLVLLAGKLVWELLYGALPGSEDMTGGAVLTDAHLYGAISGLFATFLIRVVTKKDVNRRRFN